MRTGAIFAARSFTYKSGAVLDIDTPIGKKDRALGIVRELLKKLVADVNHFDASAHMRARLFAQSYILRIAKHSAKRVTRQRSGRGLATTP